MRNIFDILPNAFPDAPPRDSRRTMYSLFIGLAGLDLAEADDWTGWSRSCNACQNAEGSFSGEINGEAERPE